MEPVLIHLNPHLDLRTGGMLDRVGDGFLHAHDQVVSRA
jgi:hypothetical protein